MTAQLVVLATPTELAQLASAANDAHRLAVASAETAVEHGVRCGALLNEAKGNLAHGEWLPWLAANFDATASTANRYMKVAAGVAGNHARVRDLTSLRQIAAAIAEPERRGRRHRKREPPEEPADYLPNILPGASPEGELHAMIVTWCRQGRDIAALLDKGITPFVPPDEEDFHVMVAALDRIPRIAARIQRRISDQSQDNRR